MQDDLREFVNLFLEDGEGGGDFSSGLGGGNEFAYWGQWQTPSGGLWKGLIAPFVDVAKTAIGGVLDLTNRAWGSLKTIVVTVLKSLVPFMKNEVDKIDATTKARTDAIERRFGDVINILNDKSLGNDFQLVMFLLNPGAYFAARLAAGSAAAVGDAFTMFTHKNLHSYYAKQRTSGYRTHKSLSDGKINEKTENDEISRVSGDVNRTKLAAEMRLAAESIVTERLTSLIRVVKQIEKSDSKGLTSMLGVRVQIDSPEAAAALVGVATKEAAQIITNIITSEMNAVKNSDLGMRKNEILNLYAAALSKISA